MISESIFSGKTVIVPMADVQHIEKHFNPDGKLLGIKVVTNKTTWDYAQDCWQNNIWIGSADNQAQEFIKAWCQYRYEFENLE